MRDLQRPTVHGDDLLELLLVKRNAASADVLAALGTFCLDVIGDANPNRRELAAQVLAWIGDHDAVPALVRLLDDRYPRVRRAAARSLALIGDQSATPALANALHDVDAEVRQIALQALITIADASVVPALIGLFEDADPSVRQYAAKALGNAGDPAAVAALIGCLSDPDSRVNQAAADALGEIGDPAAVDELFAIVNDETSYYRLKEGALQALAKINPPTMNAMLFRLLDQPYPDLRRSVVHAIQRITREDDVQTLLNVADSHGSLVRPVRDALIRSGGEAVETVLVANLTHVREWIRSLAVEVLGAIGSRRGVNGLLAALADDTHAEVRVLAASALGQIGDPQAISGLVAALENADWRIEVAAAVALERIDTPEAQQAARAWRKRTDPDDTPPALDFDDLT